MVFVESYFRKAKTAIIKQFHLKRHFKKKNHCGISSDFQVTMYNFRCKLIRTAYILEDIRPLEIGK